MVHLPTGLSGRAISLLLFQWFIIQFLNNKVRFDFIKTYFQNNLENEVII